MPAPPELVIFDCDGVLVDSERLSIEVEVRVLEQLGISMTVAEVVERFMGRSNEDVTRLVEELLGRTLPADWEDEFRPLYEKAFEELEAVAGIETALDRIALKTCVASSGSHRKIRRSLEHTGLWPRFEGRIFSASDVARGKPAPDLFLHAAASMGVSPDRCVVVEDSSPGVAGARAAGMRVLAYAGGGLTALHHYDGPATVVFHDMDELPGLIEAAGADADSNRTAST
jgi:HAD superfamily hydrolase (TIGR01509 family)